jgi:hypothetical protein
MKSRTLIGLALAAVALGSCGGHQPVQINPDTQSFGTRWNGRVSSSAELAGVSAIRGQAWMGADEKNPNQTEAHVEISNAVPGGVHPWHVHRGQCGSDQGIFGPADAYDPLKVNGDGHAESKATLPVPLPKPGVYSVNIHASANNMRTIIACGNLAPPAR